MLKVKILFFTRLREIIGKKEEVIDLLPETKITINMILSILTKKYTNPFEEYIFNPKTRRIRGHLQFLINGKTVRSASEMEIELKDGDVLAILPPVGGG
ncbi:MAG: hypothetical protein AC479_05475 [miscellaneous Crenarchaeota group-6 archaeon AD8-1]|nr:MAG: hypothetical protein AC479_05475 [miscellaneous Crenarchaeota group-6 archaeon AD8-1]